MITKILSALAQIFILGLGLYEKWQMKQEQKRVQKDANNLEENPADWFNNHFDGGMRDNENKKGVGPPETKDNDS